MRRPGCITAGRTPLPHGGGVGFAEGYIEGDWDTPDLATLLELLSVNEDAWGQSYFGGSGSAGCGGRAHCCAATRGAAAGATSTPTTTSATGSTTLARPDA